VADYDDEPALMWRKSTRSNSQGCLEVAFTEGLVLLRDSKRPDGPVLSISQSAWTAFMADVRGSADRRGSLNRRSPFCSRAPGLPAGATRAARKISGKRPGRPVACRPMGHEHQDRAAGQSEAAKAPSVGQPDDSGRVSLRPATSADESEFLGLVRASARLHHPWMSLPATPEEFRTYIRRYQISSDESLLICLRSTGAIAGMVNINSIIRGRFQCGSLGYAGFAPTAGQGYMAEGLGLVVRYAFEQLRLHRLEANIQPGNHASLKLVQRLGFRREGYSPELLFIDGAWRDHERWAITTTMIGTVAEPHPSLPGH